MSETIPLSPKIEQTPPFTDYRAAEAYVAGLEAEHESLSETVEAVFSGLDEPVRRRAEALAATLDEEVVQKREQGEPIPRLSDYLVESGDVPAELVDILARLEDCEEQAKQAIAGLEHFAPEKNRDVAAAAADIEARIDYDAVVGQMYNETEGMRLPQYNVSFVINARKLLEANAGFTYDQLQSIEHSLDNYRGEWSQSGIFRDEPVSLGSQAPEASLTTDEMDSLEALFADAADVQMKFRFGDDHHRAPMSAIRQQIRDLRREPDVVTPQTLFYLRDLATNDAFDAARNRHLNRSINELPAQYFEPDTDSDAYHALVEEARSLDLQEALDKLEVAGDLADLPFELTETELKQYLAENLPPLAIAYTTRVEFVDSLPASDGRHTTHGLNEHNIRTGLSTIFISRQALRKTRAMHQKVAEKFPDSDPAANTKDEMLTTLTHEFGHTLHLRLPFAALKRWRDSTAHDPTNITEYVMEMHDQGFGKASEEFCDTLSLFVQKPEVLDVISEARMMAMKQIYEDFMPGYGEGLKQRQTVKLLIRMMIERENPGHEAEIRRVYLMHEQADPEQAITAEVHAG